MKEATLEFKIGRNTERIKILEEKVDKNVRKINETEIDVVGIKKDMSLMNGNIKILIDSESEVLDGICRIEKNLPKNFWERFKVWHFLILLMIMLFSIGVFNG